MTLRRGISHTDGAAQTTNVGGFTGFKTFTSARFPSSGTGPKWMPTAHPSRH
jgi:hypothetical protein